MAIKEKMVLESIVLELLRKTPQVRVADILAATEMSKTGPARARDRKAIGRLLASLCQRGVIMAHGVGRGRTYSLVATESHSSFEAAHGILLSADSERLLSYVSQPLKRRVPISYQQEFLRSYQPNETFYLSQEQRAEFLKIGIAEVVAFPAGTYARKILNRLLIDLSWNSSRLEGNTYSLLETKRLIELGESASNRDAFETQMILNHKSAIEYMIAASDVTTFTSHEICSIHALLSENLLGDPSASGRLRQIAVGIGGTTYLPLENPHVLRECFQIFIEKWNSIEDPFEQSFFSLVHLSYMQAFEDVNKRTARLLANVPLIKNNLRPLSFVDVDNDIYVKSLLGVYEKNDVSLMRDLFAWAYNRSAQRYTAVQQSLGESHLLRLKFRSNIHEIVRTLVLNKTPGAELSQMIEHLVQAENYNATDAKILCSLIEFEIMNLHDGNIAQFKLQIRDFEAWKKVF